MAASTEILGKFSRRDLLVGGAALLFAIDLLFLPWVDVSATVPTINGVSFPSYSFTSSGTGAPDGFLGILAVLLALVVVGDLLLERLTAVALPALPVSRQMARTAAAGGAFLLVLLKFVLHLHPSYLGFGCWLGIVLGILMAGGSIVAGQKDQLASSVQ
ncbi:MAG: hypothetical protein ACYDDZ_13425 [Acidimicrobiales bacterium]